MAFFSKKSAFYYKKRLKETVKQCKKTVFIKKYVTFIFVYNSSGFYHDSQTKNPRIFLNRGPLKRLKSETSPKKSNPCYSKCSG